MKIFYITFLFYLFNCASISQEQWQKVVKVNIKEENQLNIHYDERWETRKEIISLIYRNTKELGKFSPDYDLSIDLIHFKLETIPMISAQASFWEKLKLWAITPIIYISNYSEFEVDYKFQCNGKTYINNFKNPKVIVKDTLGIDFLKLLILIAAIPTGPGLTELEKYGSLFILNFAGIYTFADDAGRGSNSMDNAIEAFRTEMISKISENCNIDNNK